VSELHANGWLAPARGLTREAYYRLAEPPPPPRATRVARAPVAELLKTVAEPLAWKADGLCAEYSQALFFPKQGEPNDEARAICRRCLVLDECREYAIAQGPELVGIWGDTSALERRRLRGAGSPIGEKPNEPDERVRTALALRAEGIPAADIARRLGVHRRTIYAYLDRGAA
jgi:WhiB family redox-sensing transcriptional regulator